MLGIVVNYVIFSNTRLASDKGRKCHLFYSHYLLMIWNCFLQRHPDSGLVIDDIVLIILLFANDMVIFGKTPQELPYNLNNLQSYCTK